MVEDDLNSSDSGIRDHEDENLGNGPKAIASMIKRSAADRIESEKKVKQLQDVAGAPSTAANRQY